MRSELKPLCKVYTESQMRLLTLPLAAASFAVCHATTSYTNSSSTTPLGDLIISGLGGAAVSSLAKTTAASTVTSSFVTGSGLAFASSCQTALWAWSAASESYGSQHKYHSPTTWTYSEIYTSTAITSFISANRLTTLCDGHPRVVGSATFLNMSTESLVGTETLTSLVDATDYPTPSPCSISPSDCAALWSSYESHNTNSQLNLTTEPPCAATGTANPLTRASCNDPLIYGSTAQLLYWPVRTVPGSGDLCGASVLADPVNSAAPLPKYITGTPTGDGPNTFVTAGVTITSPTVAISLAGLSRGDGCGATIDHTIVPVLPEQVSSVRGQHAAFQHYPFNFADLNWICQMTNASDTVQDHAGPDCYQNVPADAYFGGEIKWESVDDVPPCSITKADNLTGFNCLEQLTIVNDYRPAIMPPDTMLNVATRIWGPEAQWFIDGVWDPPQALNEVATEAGVGGPPTASASATAESDVVPASTPATPAEHSVSQASATAEPDSLGGSTTASQSVQTSNGAAGESSKPTATATSASRDPVGGLASALASVAQAADSSAGSNNAGTTAASLESNDPSSKTPAEPSDPASNSPSDPGNFASAATIVSVGSSAVQVVHVSSAIVVAGQTLSQGGSAATVNGVKVSAGSSGLVVGGENVATTVALPPADPSSPGSSRVTIGASVVAVVSSGSNVIVGSQTLSIGGNAQTVHGQVVSLGSSGLVVGTGGSATTVAVAAASADPAAQQITIGSQTLAVTSSGNNLILGSQTLSAGGPAQTINGEVVSAGSSGLVIGSGAAASTVPVSASSGSQEVTLGGQRFAATSTNGDVVVDGHTLSAGGPAETINGQIVSAGSAGLIIGTGSQATTVAVGAVTAKISAGVTGQVLTLGSMTLTQVLGSNGAELLENAQTTMTLSPGGAAVSIGSEIVSADPTGLDIQSGSSRIHISAPTVMSSITTSSVNTGSSGSSGSSGSIAGPATTSSKSDSSTNKAFISAILGLSAGIVFLLCI